MNGIQFTDESFEKEVLGSDRPVLVDVWASWCGPCRTLEPVVAEIATEYEGRIKVGKLNTDDNPETPSKLKVAAIPTLLFVNKGKIVDRIVGVQPKSAIKAKLEAMLASKEAATAVH